MDTFRTYRELPISDKAAEAVGAYLEAIKSLMEEEGARMEKESQETEWMDVPGLPPELRRKVLILGSSTQDYLFWVYKKDLGDGGDWYEVTEIETGVSVGGVTPREALDNYFKGEW